MADYICNLARKEQGAISVFLALLILIVFLFTGVLYDLAMIESAKADTLDALRLSSNAMLSHYDEELFEEYGLFAISDFEGAQAKGKMALEARLNTRLNKDDRDNSLNTELISIDAKPVKNKILANPDILEEEILGMMDWQLPIRGVDAVLSKFSFYQRASQAVDSFKSKIDFEKKLNSVQGKIEDLSSQWKTMAENDGNKMIDRALDREPSEKDQGLVKSIPSIKERMLPIYTNLYDLFLVYKSSRPTETEGLSKELEDAAKTSLQKISSYYTETLQAMVSAENSAASSIRQLEALVTPATDLDQAYDEWGQAIDSLPAGELAQSLRGDYYATHKPGDTVEMEALKEDLVEAEDLLHEQGIIWSNLTYEDKLIRKFSVQDWFVLFDEAPFTHLTDKAGNQQEQAFHDAVESLFYQSGGNWERKVEFQETAQKMQVELEHSSQEGRTGILEFISSWNKKRKAKAEAKKAARKNLPLITGSIGDYGIGPSDKSAFDAYKSGQKAFSIADLQGGGDEAYVDGAIGQMDDVAYLLEEANLATAAKETLSLLGYWRGMFSHRLSALRSQEDKSADISLTGTSMSERTLYGAELEFILFGKDNIQGNLRTAENWISGLRLITNMLYAFTSADLRQEASLIAFGLAGWTGFGVPFVKTVLLVIAAVGETWLDMGDLTSGDDLPIIKTRNTWRFSISGIKAIANDMVEDLFNLVEDELASGIEALGEVSKDSLNEIKNSALQTVEDALTNPLQSFVQGILTQIDTSKQEISNKFDDMMSSLSSYSMEGAVGDAYSSALQDLKARKAAFVYQVDQVYQKKFDSGGITEGILSEAKQLVDNLLAPVLEVVNTKVDQLTDKWLNSLEGLREKGEKVTKEAVQGWLDGFTQDLGGGSLSADLSVAASMTLTYEDYLLFVLLMKMASEQGKRELLVNTSMAIQMEIESLDILQAATEVEQDIAVDVSIFFLNNIDGSLTLRAPEESFVRKNRWRIEEKWKEGYGK